MTSAPTHGDENLKAEHLPPQPPRLGGVALAFRLLFIAAVLGIAVALTFWMLGSKPKSKPRPKARTAPLVDVAPAQYGAHAIRVPAMGTVIAARDLELRPEVTGRVIELSEALVPGGTVREGELLLRIDPRDYELAVARQKSALEQARSELALERGNQIVARQEFALLGESVSDEEESLILRRPQLQALEAEVAAAEVALEQAQLELQRTLIRAPFNAVVVEESVELGARVSEGTTLARLAGTDTFWVEASVPVDQLDFLNIPGARVQLERPGIDGSPAPRSGSVIRRLPALESEGRMARVLAEFSDPLGLEGGSGRPLLLGAFVQLQIEGRTFDRALSISREHLRQGETLWVFSPEGTLDIREVTVDFRDRSHVLVTGGVEEGERIIVSDLSAPVEGMPLRSDETPAAAEEKP